MIKTGAWERTTWVPVRADVITEAGVYIDKDTIGYKGQKMGMNIGS